MELIHYANNGCQYLSTQWPSHYDEMLGQVELTRNAMQELPHSAIHSILRGELAIGEVASVMSVVMERSPFAAQALSRAVAESKGYAAGHPNLQCPRVWLAEATDVVSPSFLAAPSWSIVGKDVFRYDRWMDKPNTISLMTPPVDAAAILSGMDDTKAGQLSMLIDMYRDAPEFASRVAACLNLDWPALLDRACTGIYTPEALALADSHGFLPGVYTFRADTNWDYWRDFSIWAATHPGVSVYLSDSGTNLYNGHPLTDTAEAIIDAYDKAMGY